MKAAFYITDHQMYCCGDWVKSTIPALEKSSLDLSLMYQETLAVDGSQLGSLDTSGVIFLLNRLKPFLKTQSVVWIGFSEYQQGLIQLLLSKTQDGYQKLPAPEAYLIRLGKFSCQVSHELIDFLSYFGESMALIWQCFTKNSKIRWVSVAYHIQTTGYQAMPIVGLLSFLIGLVLAYQLGHTLANYGASIYIVEISGMAILREFGPLITAIILAGRTSSSYTAQLGSMILTEEVDALSAMGCSISELLLLPRIIGLLISLPLLSVLSDICGTLGSLFMSQIMLGLSYMDFIYRFGHVIDLKTFFMGMIKTPFFALLISSIGCFHGLQIRGDTTSLGYRTTLSVVHAIFMIIVADAGFSILFNRVSL